MKTMCLVWELSFRNFIFREWFYVDANKTAGEEARQQLLKNAASNIEQILAATHHKTPAIRPPVSHNGNYPS